MALTHYEVLGLKPDATRSEIRSAYRRLVLVHHPDRSKDPRSKGIFLEATNSYEILSDPEAKNAYDERLAMFARRAEEEARKRAEAIRREEESSRLHEERRATPTGATVAQEIARLQSLYGTGRHNDAEKLAHSIIQIDPRQAVPYAVLADIHRGRGQINEASKMYAYAVQMDPNNAVYQKRYEGLLNNSKVIVERGNTRLDSEDKRVLAPMVGGGFVVASGLYVAFSSELPAIPRMALVSTWTFGLMVTLFLAGVCVGAALAVGNWLDRFESMTNSSSGRAGPTLILGIVAMVNFWVSAILYILIALGLRAFNYSTSRMMATVAFVTLFMAALCIPTHSIVPYQTLVWGGNLVYVGGLVGWMATDSMRP